MSCIGKTVVLIALVGVTPELSDISFSSPRHKLF
jgi:hypothetical protein